MPRRAFISFQSDDRMQARRFVQLKLDPDVQLDISARHLIDPVQSYDEAYIKRRINEEMDGTSMTIVLIGENTHTSEYVAYEIQRTVELGHALLGIRVPGAENARVPAGLEENGAEIINYEEAEFNPAIARAQTATRVGRLTQSSGGGSAPSGGCVGRQPA